MSKYTEESALAALRRKQDINVIGRTIEQLKDGRGDVGNGTVGIISYLINHHGYTRVMVTKFTK